MLVPGRSTHAQLLLGNGRGVGGRSVVFVAPRHRTVGHVRVGRRELRSRVRLVAKEIFTRVGTYEHVWLSGGEPLVCPLLAGK